MEVRTMRVDNCEQCGKLFSSLSSRLCPECADRMDTYLGKAKEVLYRRPDIGVMDLAEEANIPFDVLKTFMREGRLQFRQTGTALIDCEMCGRPIISGTKCQACQDRLTGYVTQMKQPQEPPGAGMHSLRITRNRKDAGE
jgi:ribosomal protein L32